MTYSGPSSAFDKRDDQDTRVGVDNGGAFDHIQMQRTGKQAGEQQKQMCAAIEMAKEKISPATTCGVYSTRKR